MDNQLLGILNQGLTKSVDGNQYVTFTIDDEEFGIGILKVHEIIGYIKPTHVPNMPDYVNGVINLRGLVIPILDVRKKFKLQHKEYDKFTVIVVVEVSNRTMGLIVDSVSDVISLSENEIQDVDSFSKYRPDAIKGMGKVGDKLIVLLDIDKVVDGDEYSLLAQVHDKQYLVENHQNQEENAE